MPVFGLFNKLFTITALTVDASCQNTNNKDTRTISSPKYPSNYPNSKHCTWKITAPSGAKIEISSFYFRIESSSGCKYDSLTIYDGPSSSSNRKRNLCGNRNFGGMTSTGNTIYLVFKSDGSTRYKGFELSYSVIGKN